VKSTRAMLDRNGFTDVPIEVSEGGILFGMDGKWMWHGLAPGGMIDGTWTAWVFWKLLENNVDVWSRWPLLRTQGLFKGPEATSTHAMRLIAEMSEDARVAVDLPEDDRLIRVISGVAPDGNTLRVLAFHHAIDVTKPTESADLDIELTNLPFDGAVRISKTVLDKDHGDFWPQWEKDRENQRLTDKDYFRSRDQFDVAHALNAPHQKAIWEHYEKQYEPLSRFPDAESSSNAVTNRSLSLHVTLPCLSVVLFEIKGEL